MRSAIERWRGVLGLLVCLGLAVVIAVAAPDPEVDLRRRFVDVEVNEPAQIPLAVARVTRVQVSNAAQRAYGDPWVSDQTLVVVSVEAAARRQVVQFNQVVLRTGADKTYEPRSEFSSAGLAQTQPGFTRTATLVFELPPDQAAGAVLVIDPDAAAFDSYGWAIRVDLGLRRPVVRGPGPVTVTPSALRVT